MTALLEPHGAVVKGWAFRYRAPDKQRPSRIPIDAFRCQYN